MNAFSDANDILFEDDNIALDATFKVADAGTGTAVRVVLSTPDEQMEWREARLVVGTVILEVRMSEVASLARGDSFEVTSRSATYLVTGDPLRDDQNLTWRAEARPK